ncbi:MAG: peptidoglycan bridge formation glycyltransferase FemA/FemB family protein, partial [Candidatus Kapaibacteriota bacterium]
HIRESHDYYTFNEILVKNKAKHNAKPTHSLEDMLCLSQLVPNRVRLNMVYYEEKPIAGSWLFICNPKVVLCFYNMLLYEFEHLKPVYLIMYETVRWALEQGFEWVDIGVSQDTKSADPMTPALSLIQFKERFNSRGILRSTYHYKFRD